jgi:hypothetical protein
MTGRLRNCLLLLILMLGVAQAEQKKPQADQLASTAVRGDAQALQQLRTLAEQGNARAQFRLGLMYADGTGVPKDQVQAEQWYRKAAEQGEANAQAHLGGMYENGSVVSKDIVTAYMWYNLAAAKGNPKFRNDRDQLEKQMTGQQIADAQKLSREWKSK